MRISVAVLGLFAFLVVFLSPGKALAVSSNALPVRKIYSVSPVGPYVPVELVASLQKGAKGIQINNTGIHPVEIAFGGSGGEVAQVLIGGSQDTGFLPLTVGYATRLSAVTLDGPNETGELDMTVFYN